MVMGMSWVKRRENINKGSAEERATVAITNSKCLLNIRKMGLMGRKISSRNCRRLARETSSKKMAMKNNRRKDIVLVWERAAEKTVNRLMGKSTSQSFTARGDLLATIF